MQNLNTLDEQIRIFENNAEWIRKDGDLLGCLNFKQMAEWLQDYKRLKEMEPCEDAISRQAALDTIESWLSCDDYNEAERHIMRATQSVLYDLPSVTPKQRDCENCCDGIQTEKAKLCQRSYLAGAESKQRTGHWIDTGWKFQTDTDEILYGYGCSECGGISFFRKYDNKILGGKWCHCCGARMVEPQESDHKCHTCKHYTSGENDGSCGSYICK